MQTITQKNARRLITEFVQCGLRLRASVSRSCWPLHSMLQRVKMYMDAAAYNTINQPSTCVEKSLMRLSTATKFHSKTDLLST